MTRLAAVLLEELGDEELDALAAALAPRLAALESRSATSDPWLNSDQAAEHLGCSRSRVHDLVQLRRLEPRRDGRSLRFRRSDLDRYLEGASDGG